MLDATLNGSILIDHTIDLNSHGSNENIILDIISTDDDLSSESSWYVDSTTRDDDIMSLVKLYNNRLQVNVDLDGFKSSEFFVLGNVNGDTLRINVAPNVMRSARKRYSFRVSKPNISFDNEKKEITIDKITSSVNGEKLPWVVSNDGFPLKYEITTTPNKCVLRLLSDVVGEFTSEIILTQESSSKRLVIVIYYVLGDDGNVKIDKVDVVNF